MHGSVELWFAIGNELADGVAGSIAARLRVDTWYQRVLDALDHHTRLVQQRLIALEISCAERRTGKEEDDHELERPN